MISGPKRAIYRPCIRTALLSEMGNGSCVTHYSTTFLKTCRNCVHMMWFWKCLDLATRERSGGGGVFVAGHLGSNIFPALRATCNKTPQSTFILHTSFRPTGLDETLHLHRRRAHPRPHHRHPPGHGPRPPKPALYRPHLPRPPLASTPTAPSHPAIALASPTPIETQKSKIENPPAPLAFPLEPPAHTPP